MRELLASYATTIALLALVSAVLSRNVWALIAVAVFAFAALIYLSVTRDEPRGEDEDSWFI